MHSGAYRNCKPALGKSASKNVPRQQQTPRGRAEKKLGGWMGGAVGDVCCPWKTFEIVYRSSFIVHHQNTIRIGKGRSSPSIDHGRREDRRAASRHIRCRPIFQSTWQPSREGFERLPTVSADAELFERSKPVELVGWFMQPLLSVSNSGTPKGARNKRVYSSAEA